MFAREKPLPQPVLSPDTPQNHDIEGEGILLGSTYWNPEGLPNGHIVAIGSSGSGKTQTLKAIAHELRHTYPQIQVILIDFHSAQGGVTRKKVYMSPNSNDQVLLSQSMQGFEALDHDPSPDDQVLSSQSEQGFEALDHSSSPTRESPELKIGDCVEIQKGCFSYRKVEVVGFPADKPGWVQVKQKGWQVTQEYQLSDLRLVQ